MKKLVLAPLRRLRALAKATQKKIAAYMAKRPHRSFRRTLRPKNRLGGMRLPSVWATLKDVNAFVRAEKWLLFKLGLVYAIVSFLFAGGVSQVDFAGLKESTVQSFSGDPSAIFNAVTLFTSAVTGTISLPASELQQFMGILLILIFCLAVIWAARARFADKAVKARDALYNACAPLVPAAVLVCVIAVQLLPAAAAIFLFSILQGGAVFEGGVEVMTFSVAAILLFLLSIYWVSASLLSLVVVTLPGVYPWKALSSASELVVGQRWAIAARLLVLLVIIALLWAAVLLPALLLDGWLRWDWLPLIPIVVQLLNAICLVYGSVYVYKLYRSLL